MIHIYTGDGKGKTTAAMGLAVRAAGRERRVTIVQFLKGRDTGELASFKLIPQIVILRNQENYGFFRSASPENQKKIIQENNDNLKAALSLPSDLLILDEICAAYNLEALDRAMADALVKDWPADRELVLTGRNPPENFIAAADYISEIRKVKHPFDQGIPAREGVEF